MGWGIENKMKLADRLRGSGVELTQADVQQYPSVPPLLELRSHHQTVTLQTSWSAKFTTNHLEVRDGILRVLSLQTEQNVVMFCQREVRSVFMIH